MSQSTVINYYKLITIDYITLYYYACDSIVCIVKDFYRSQEGWESLDLSHSILDQCYFAQKSEYSLHSFSIFSAHITLDIPLHSWWKSLDPSTHGGN